MLRLPHQRSRNPDLRARFAGEKKNQHKRNGKGRGRAFWLGWRRCARLFTAFAGNGRERRSVELRALCNEVPRTPPGPEGSNGTGNASGAADHPEFLSLKNVYSIPSPVFGEKKMVGCGWLFLFPVC